MREKATPEVKLICAVTYAPSIDIENVIACLESSFGMVDTRSEIIDFDHTEYYEAEMGQSLKKVLLGFDNLIRPENLRLIKRATGDIEVIFAQNGKRRVNLDPGYLETSKLVLASTKNFSHRIYLGDGIYGEITLMYAEGAFHKLPWTYPDYLSESFIGFLGDTREKYKRLVR